MACAVGYEADRTVTQLSPRHCPPFPSASRCHHCLPLAPLRGLPAPCQAAASRGARARAFVQHAECAQCHCRAGQMASRRPTAHGPVSSQESAERVQARCLALGCWRCPRPGPSVSPADGRAVCPEHKCPGAAGWKGRALFIKEMLPGCPPETSVWPLGARIGEGAPPSSVPSDLSSLPV